MEGEKASASSGFLANLSPSPLSEEAKGSDPFSEEPTAIAVVTPEVAEEEEEEGWLSTTTPSDLCGGDTTSAETVLETVDSCVNCMNGIDATTAESEDPAFVVPRIDAASHFFVPFDPLLLTQMDLLCGTEESSTRSSCPSMTTTNAEVQTTHKNNLEHTAVSTVCELCEMQLYKKDDNDHHPSLKMPCCPGRSLCSTCFRMISYPLHERLDWNDPDHRVGRCPFCKMWIQMDQDPRSGMLAVSNPSSSSCCGICNQTKDICWLRKRLGESPEQQQQQEVVVCDACFLGQVQPLWYECRTCRVRQSIQHPMYRYQPSPDAFGNQTWTCLSCGKFTYWRIVAQQCRYIPIGDAPWIREDALLTEAQTRIHEIQKAVIKEQLQVMEAKQGTQEETCIII
jgi:hypothetical protein